jgi:hypothetical protein
MPIVWKVSFEEPLIRLIQAGQISNSKRLVDAIALQYDLSIKQGLPNPPGTPAGPLINGNILAFKKALNAFYKLEAIKQQALVVAIYVKTAKSLLQTIKSTYKDISDRRKELRTVVREQSKNVRELKRLRRVKTLDAARQIAVINSKNSKLLILKVEILSFIESKRQYITDFIRPKIKALKDELKSLIKKILLPALQTSQIAIIKSIPKLIKNVIKEIKDKKKQYLDVIKKNIVTVNSTISIFKKLRGSISGSDASRLKSCINSMIKSTNPATLTKNADIINLLLSKYGDDKIDPKVKAGCRSAVTKIISLKIEISNLKEEARSFLLEKLQERKDDVIKSLKPKFGPGPSKILEARTRIKELRSMIAQYKTLVTRVSNSRKVYSKVRSEYSRVRRLKDSSQFIPTAAVADVINKQFPGQGSRYLEIKSSREAKAFLYGVLISALASNEQLNELKNKYKNNILEIKNKILSQRFNPREIIFNVFLRLAVLGYWTGGIMPNLGIVIFPGVVTLPVSLKPTSNPANFIRSLSKTLQLHTKTVTGTYTIPGTPPVVLPWVGYN